jgi:prepilin-type N-terminal cleavage/methylation domain-containing protein
MSHRESEHAGGGEKGFSLVEVIVASAVLFIVVALAAQALQSGNRLLGVTSAQSEAENRAGGIAEKICQHLRPGILVTLTDGAGLPLLDGASTVNGVGIQTFVQWEGGPKGGESFRFVLKPGELLTIDGKDNDRDNYVDEMTLHLQTWNGPAVGFPARDVPIGNNVKSLSVRRTGRKIAVVLTVLKYDPSMREVREFVHRAEAAIKN